MGRFGGLRTARRRASPRLNPSTQAPTAAAQAPISAAQAPTSAAHTPTSAAHTPTAAAQAPISAVRAPTSAARTPISAAPVPTWAARTAISAAPGPTWAAQAPRFGGKGAAAGYARLSSAEMASAAARRRGTARSPKASSTRLTGPETEIAVGVGALGTAIEKQRTPISCSCSSIA